MCGSANICTVIVQFVIATLSFAASMSIIDATEYLGFDLNKQNRVIIIICASISSLFLICYKACFRFAKWDDNDMGAYDEEELDDERKAFVAAKQLFLGLTDTTFDIIAAIAILNGVDIQFSNHLFY